MLFTPKHSFILDHCIRLKGVIEQWFPTQPPDLRDKTEKKEIFLFHKIMYELEGSLLTLEIAIFHKKKKQRSERTPERNLKVLNRIIIITRSIYSVVFLQIFQFQNK